jgi:hypothetical protein
VRSFLSPLRGLFFPLRTHGLRRGLHSYAATRLERGAPADRYGMAAGALIAIAFIAPPWRKSVYEKKAPLLAKDARSGAPEFSGVATAAGSRGDGFPRFDQVVGVDGAEAGGKIPSGGGGVGRQVGGVRGGKNSVGS